MCPASTSHYTITSRRNSSAVSHATTLPRYSCSTVSYGEPLMSFLFVGEETLMNATSSYVLVEYIFVSQPPIYTLLSGRTIIAPDCFFLALR